MNSVMVALLPLLLMSPNADAGQVGHLAPPPDAGISDSQLQSLGSDADNELAKRFADPGNADFRPGLLYRMRLYGNLSQPNTGIADTLKQFIESETHSCDGVVDRQRVMTIGSALEVLGQRGGDAGQKYLDPWVMDNAVSERVHCYYAGGKVEKTRDLLRDSAVIGLGLSGTQSSLEFLKKIARNPPKVNYPGSFRGVLDRAMDENQTIQKEGIVKHYQADRNHIKDYEKKSELSK